MRPDAPTDLLRLPAGIDLDDARLIDRLQRDPADHRAPVCRRRGRAADGRAAGHRAPAPRLLGSGVLTRFGPLFHIERAGGQFILAALQVPDERYGEVTQQVNALPEVAHNYRRDHALNMWFVVAAETPEAAWAACDQHRGRHRPARARLPQGARILSSACTCRCCHAAPARG
jgi:hypothetical protein